MLWLCLKASLTDGVPLPSFVLLTAISFPLVLRQLLDQVHISRLEYQVCILMSE